MRKSAGFTLIELMVAMSIFALAGTAIIKTTSEHLNSLSSLEEITMGQWVAANRLAEIQLEKTFPPKDKKQEEVEMAGMKFYWRQVVKQTEDKQMRQVEIEIRRNENDEQTVTTLIGYVSSAG